MKVKMLLGLSISLFVILFAPYRSSGVDREEGGYVGQKGEGHDVVVYNFLKHFNYEQYYWGYKHQWSYNNNNRVDAMDFAIFAGHGNRWLIALRDGSLSLTSAGSSSIDIGMPSRAFPVTPPGIRVRTTAVRLVKLFPVLPIKKGPKS